MAGKLPKATAVKGRPANAPIMVKAEPGPGAVDTQHGAIIAALCEEPEMIEALSRCDSPKFVSFLAALANPTLRTGNMKSNKLRSAGELARNFGITPFELEMILRNHTLSKAMTKAVLYMPRIAEDLARDSLSTEIACPRCDGWGDVTRKVNDEVEKMSCPQCKGMMVIRKNGDPDARKLLLETFGWAGKNQTFINNGVVNNAQQGGVLDELEAIDRKRLIDAPIIEAETEDVKP